MLDLPLLLLPLLSLLFLGSRALLALLFISAGMRRFVIFLFFVFFLILAVEEFRLLAAVLTTLICTVICNIREGVGDLRWVQFGEGPGRRTLEEAPRAPVPSDQWRAHL